MCWTQCHEGAGGDAAVLGVKTAGLSPQRSLSPGTLAVGLQLPPLFGCPSLRGRLALPKQTKPPRVPVPLRSLDFRAWPGSGDGSPGWGQTPHPVLPAAGGAPGAARAPCAVSVPSPTCPAVGRKPCTGWEQLAHFPSPRGGGCGRNNLPLVLAQPQQGPEGTTGRCPCTSKRHRSSDGSWGSFV